MADLLLMPSAHQSLANWLMRRYEATLEEIADRIDQEPAAVQATLDALIHRGLLKAVEGEQGLVYRVNLAPKTGRQMPKDIFKVLDNASEQANVFISYSRRNKPFVERLYTALSATDREVWVDWENIPLAVDWWQEIELGIELADTFIFVLSPDSVQSQVCRQEIDHAVQHNKRLVPVVYQDVQPDQVHPELARLNWIFLRPEDDFDGGLRGLLAALDQNIDYVRTHTRLLLRALEWDNNGRDASYLLRGKDLHRANEYLVQGREEEPKPTPLHHQYVLASAEVEAAARQAEMVHQASTLASQRQWLRLVSAVSVLTIALGLTSLGLYRQTAVAQRAAERSHLEALSRSAEALFLSDQRFEALITATQAGHLLKTITPAVEDPKLYAAVTSALRQALVWVHERNRFEGHSATIWHVAFNGDGSQILSASADGTLRLWHPDGTLIQLFESPGASFHDGAISPDGQSIAAVDLEGNGYLWNLEGRLQHQWQGEGNQSAWVVQFSPDGGAIATAGADGRIDLRNTENGQLIRSLGEHRNGIQALVFSPDGDTLIAGDYQGWLYRWSITGELQAEVQAHQSPILSLALRLGTVAVASEEGQVSLWEVGQNTPDLTALEQFPAHEGPVNAVQFTPDGQKLVTAGSDKTIRFWNRNGQLQTTLLGHTGQIFAVAVHPTASVLISGGGDRALRLWDLNRPHITALQDHQEGVNSVAISPDGDTLASVGDDQKLRLWGRDGTLINTLEGPQDRILAVEFHPDGQRLIGGSADGNLYLWHRDGRLLQTLTGHQDNVNGVAFSPDGTLIASASDDNRSYLWTLEGTQVQTLEGHQDGVISVDFSPDGTTLATTGWDHRIHLWTVEGERLKTFTGHQGWVFDVQFSPDGTLLASASHDNTVRLWDVATGQPTTTLEGHRDSVQSAVFTADGDGIVTASSDNTMRFWDLEGTLQSTLSGHRMALNDVAVDPLGRYVVSASRDRTVLIWNLTNMDTLDSLLASSCDWLVDYLHTNRTGLEDICRE
ncbi:TIR domain-containing protein [Leptolyngbya sp. PCC 6406]|uniref:TIR domain-containing protein n=1 Tax=Leptolyngbya sp. PCC 6406 TaxID=1173264 RepID=UPI0002DC890B|nr:TIR domain-containing protein [Leptolyngbya sp. PCC 6406]